MSEHDKHDNWRDKYTIPTPTTDDFEEAAQREQKMFRESLAREFIQAIREDAALRRELLAVLALQAPKRYEVRQLSPLVSASHPEKPFGVWDTIARWWRDARSYTQEVAQAECDRLNESEDLRRELLAVLFPKNKRYEVVQDTTLGKYHIRVVGTALYTSMSYETQAQAQAQADRLNESENAE